MTKKKAGRPAYKRDDDAAKQVEAMSAVGITQEQIASVLGICVETLVKNYRDELDNAAAKANAAVGRSLYQKAVNGDTSAAIWWSKARMGWSEKQQHEHTGQNGGPVVVERRIVKA